MRLTFLLLLLFFLPLLNNAQSFEKAIEYFWNFEDSLALDEFLKCEDYYCKERGKNDTAYLTKIYRCIGEIYSENSEYKKADVYFTKGDSIFTQLKVKNNDYCRLMFSKAMHSWRNLSDDEFFKYKDRAMDCYCENDFNDSTHLLYAYSEFGRALFDMGQNFEAIKFCDRSIILHEELFADTCVNSEYINSIYHKAVSLMNCSEYEYAKLCFDKLRVIYEGNLEYDFVYWYSLYNLAYYYAEHGQLQEGVDLLNECIENKNSILLIDSMLYVQVLNDQGFNYFELEQYEKALEYYFSAENLMQIMSNHKNLNFNIALLYSNMALVCAKNNNVDSALLYYKMSDEIYTLEDVEKDETYIEMLCFYANLLVSSGKLADAENIINKAIENMNSILLSSLFNKNSTDKHFILSTLYDKVSAFIKYVYSLNSSFKTTCKIYDNMILVKQGMLENSVNVTTYSFENNKDQLKQQRLVQARNALKTCAMSNQLNINIDDSLTKLIYTLESDLLRTIKIQPSKKTAAHLFNSLKTNEALIDFYFYYDFDFLKKSSVINYVAFVLRPYGDSIRMINHFTNKQLSNTINSIKESTISQSPLSQTQDYELIPNLYAYQSNTSLYSLIWEPLDSLLQGVEKVYISPAGDLYNIAFDALPVSATQTLGDKYEIEYVSSAAQVALPPEPLFFSDSTNATLFGDMDYNLDTTTVKGQLLAYAETRGKSDVSLQRGGNWQSLDNSNEIEQIEQLFTKYKSAVQSYTQEKAIEESFMNLDGNSPEIIHLSTHAEYNSLIEQKAILSDSVWYETSPNPMLRSYLAMSGANSLDKAKNMEVNDGKLTAYEVSLMDLTNTRLVTLAACETGLGEIGDYEGVQGLRRAFKIAGVDYLVVSLWSVPNKQTSDFMQEFYSNFVNNKVEVRKAFKAAQNLMKRKYSDNPYYWAGFVLVY